LNPLERGYGRGLPNMFKRGLSSADCGHGLSGALQPGRAPAGRRGPCDPGRPGRVSG